MKTSLMILAALVSMTASEVFATTIPLVNASFEDPAGSKTTGDATWSNIPGWTSTGPSVDSGIQAFSPLPQPELGVNIAFLRSDDGAIYQTTGYTLQSGDIVTASFYERDDFFAEELTARFYYDDGLVRTVFDSQAVSLAKGVSQNGPLAFHEVSATVPAAAAGSLLGIEFENTTNDGNVDSGEWLWLDAVELTVVPEPGAALLSLSTIASVVFGQGRSRRGVATLS